MRCEIQLPALASGQMFLLDESDLRLIEIYASGERKSRAHQREFERC